MRIRIAAFVLVLLALAAGPALAEDPTPAPAALDVSGAGGLWPAEGPLFTPVPEQKAPPCHYCGGPFTTSPGGGAPSHTGVGGDCTAAANNLRSQLQAAANAECQNFGEAGRCALTVVQTCSCYSSGGQVVVDGYADFACWIYWC